jgi:hypothetical protein
VISLRAFLVRQFKLVGRTNAEPAAQDQLFGVRRPVGAFVGCDLSQPSIKWHRQAGADQSGVKPPHSKELICAPGSAFADPLGQ